MTNCQNANLILDASDVVVRFIWLYFYWMHLGILNIRPIFVNRI